MRPVPVMPRTKTCCPGRVGLQSEAQGVNSLVLPDHAYDRLDLGRGLEGEALGIAPPAEPPDAESGGTPIGAVICALGRRLRCGPFFFLTRV